MLTCEICIEWIPKSKRFNNNTKCGHLFCVDCIAKYIQIKVKDMTGTGIIVCPGYNCETHLDPLSCKEIISRKLFVEWCDLLCESAIPWLNSSWCPNSRCLELVVNECGGSVKKSKCPNCKESFCFHCKKKWEFKDNRNHSCCRRIRINDMNDVLFKTLMKKNKWVKCPGCGHCIERSTGCASMQCIRCLTRFCYSCGAITCICRRHCYSCGEITCICRRQMPTVDFAAALIIFVILFVIIPLYFRKTKNLN